MDVVENEQRELIISQLRESGCRITKQRLTILDIILNGDPSCVKEIYREASKIDKNIGSATVYRMVNTLEEIGVINRKNMYQVDC
ncbi:MAG: transcriptional repressor, partial [Pseudobutyrivibrio sp.]|nr:transcriptional repressor [Pseudobutyrivibrio sp.]